MCLEAGQSEEYLKYLFLTMTFPLHAGRFTSLARVRPENDKVWHCRARILHLCVKLAFSSSFLSSEVYPTFVSKFATGKINVTGSFLGGGRCTAKCESGILQVVKLLSMDVTSSGSESLCPDCKQYCTQQVKPLLFKPLLFSIPSSLYSSFSSFYLSVTE